MNTDFIGQRSALADDVASGSLFKFFDVLIKGEFWPEDDARIKVKGHDND